MQVCDALAHAHARDVIHLDVSLGNVLIAAADGTAKLADFGLASDALESSAALVRGFMGTPGYVAPEIVRGAKASPRSDLYSLGAVAYRLLLGPEAPSADPGCTAPLTTAVPRRPPLAEGLPGLARGAYEAIQQALAPEPDARQKSVAEFRAQLLDGDTPLRGGIVPFPDAIRSQVRSAA